MKKKADIKRLHEAAGRASALLKTLGHPGRLMVLCYLVEGERSVGDLADDLDMSQSSLSQHLARMRSEGLVTTRRDSQNVFYSVTDGDVRSLIQAMYRIFCSD